MTRSGSVTGPERRPVTETPRRAEPRGGKDFGDALSAEMASDAARAKAVEKRATQDRYAQNQAGRYQSVQSQAAQDRRAHSPARRDFALRPNTSDHGGTPSPKAPATARMSDSVPDTEEALATVPPSTPPPVGVHPPAVVISEATVDAPEASSAAATPAPAGAAAIGTPPQGESSATPGGPATVQPAGARITAAQDPATPVPVTPNADPTATPATAAPPAAPSAAPSAAPIAAPIAAAPATASTDAQAAAPPAATATAALPADKTVQAATPDGVTTTTTADPAVAEAPSTTPQNQSGDSGGGNSHPDAPPKDPNAAPAVVFAGVPQTQAAAATAPAAAPQAALPLPGPPATQLAMRIAPLLLDADGVHRLTVHLHPADLGPVQVIAEIRNGEINVQLSGGTDAGNDALRNAMEDLRRELDRSGFSSTTLDLRQGPNQDQARQQYGFMPTGRTGIGPDPSDLVPEPATPQPTGPDPDGHLDIKA